LENKV